MQREQVILKVAIAMREAYGRYIGDPVIPWRDAAEDRKAAWLAIAEVAVDTIHAADAA